MPMRFAVFVFPWAALSCAAATPSPVPSASPGAGAADASVAYRGAVESVDACACEGVRDARGECACTDARDAIVARELASGENVGGLGSQDAASDRPEVARAIACNEQSPQEFLVRGNFLKEGAKGNLRAIQYRTEQYGYFKGYGHPGPGAEAPSAFLRETTFMGLRVKMHQKVAPALACVEEEIVRSCAAHPYRPHALAGIRYKNTYRGGEVTNHAYGIAIDIDPGQNTCCGCVSPWNDAPACKRPAKTEYDRMAMPECWVHAFERFGFYWLGHDKLRDTMHFEFLGDPEKIERTAGDPSWPSERSDGGMDGGRRR